MTNTLHQATKGGNANAAAYSGGGGGGVLDLLFGGGGGGGGRYSAPSESQTPVLSCDRPIDLNTPLMI